MAEQVHILVGTKKGAFIYTSDDARRLWQLSAPMMEGSQVFHMVADALNAMFVIAHYRSSSLPAPRTKCIDAVHLSPAPCTHGMKSSAGPGLKIHRSQRQGHCTAEAIV